MSKIESIKAREILDSRGNPTVEVDVFTKEGMFRAAVPSGSSTGVHEALELRDDNNPRYSGKGVLTAVNHVNLQIAEKIIDIDCTQQKEIDDSLISLDGTENKTNLGANAMLAVSMAVCRAGAAAKKIPLYQHIAELAGEPTDNYIMPVPSFNVINGGKHAGNQLPLQEFMFMPTKVTSFKEALRIGSKVYHILKEIISNKYGKAATGVGDEGGFMPDIVKGSEALSILKEAIEKAGHLEEIDIKISMDCAASEFYDDGLYDLNFKDPIQENKITSEELSEMYAKFIKDFSVVSIEDTFDQDDWEAYTKFTAEFGDKTQNVVDDLLVTNPKRIAKAIEEKACNALLLKVNQIGTISEAIDSCREAKEAGWGVMVSHRSGETEDSFIADLAVGLRAGQIKSGAPCRSERLAKYNQLLRIEEELGDRCSYAGEHFREP